MLVVWNILGPCRRITTSQYCTRGVLLQILWKGLLGQTCRQKNIPWTPRMIVSAAQWSLANLSLSWEIWRWLLELPLLHTYTAGRLAARLTAQIESALRLEGSHAPIGCWCRLMLSACSNKQYTGLMEEGTVHKHWCTCCTNGRNLGAPTSLSVSAASVEMAEAIPVFCMQFWFLSKRV